METEQTMDKAETTSVQPDEAMADEVGTESTEASDEVSEAASGDEHELAALRARVRELEEQALARERLSERVGRECAEFEQCFPAVSLHGVPDEVWAQVHAGVPLSAAYALYEKKREGRQRAEQQARQRCATMPTGIAEEAGQSYFSPAQVRAMSPHEVRENYDRIFESMRHWQ